MKFEVIRSSAGPPREGDYTEVIPQPPIRVKRTNGETLEIEQNLYLVEINTLEELLEYQKRIGHDLIIELVPEGTLRGIEIYDEDRETWRRG